MSVISQVQRTPIAGLTATVSREGAVTVVALRGEADRATLHVAVDALSDVISDGDGDVVVDLAQMEFIDSAALRALLRAQATLEGSGRHLTLRSPSRIAARLLGVFGLEHMVGLSIEGKGTQ